MNALAEYQNERLFFAQLDGEKFIASPGSIPQFLTPSIRLFFVKSRNCGFKIAEIFMSHGSRETWIRMKPNQQEKDVRLFTAEVDTNVNYSTGELFVFRIKIISTIQNNGFHVVDATYSTGDLWCELDFTDVDLLVGQEKFEAHRVVLSARSPIFETLLSNISNTGRPTLTIRADVEFTIMEEFLKYLYNGSLEISANNKQLLALAEMYQVETLKEICQLAVREVDVEDITSSLLALI